MTIRPEDASEFINKSAVRYLNALNYLKGLFQEFKFNPESLGAVYAVYSRADKQKGDEFKEALKVAKKVNSARASGNPQKGIGPDPNFPIQDLKDIIGLTVVVVYPSDVDAIKAFIESQRDQGKIAIQHSEEKGEHGYRAHHFVVSITHPRYAGILCEVQVKTLLHDAWSAKTHDLTYKPAGIVHPTLVRQFELLSTQLSVIDTQSEVLKGQIQEVWDLDAKRKNAAKLALVRAMAGGSVPGAQPERATRYRVLVENLKASEAKYRNGEVWEIVQNLKDFAGMAPYDMHTCILLTLLAVYRIKDDLDDLALDSIERWVRRPLDDPEKRHALAFKAFALFCFNFLEDAIEVSEQALAIARRLDDKRVLEVSLLDTAYYLADAGWIPERTETQMASVLLTEFLASSGGEENLHPAYKDSVGFVRIASAQNVVTARGGLALCKQASDASPDEVGLACYSFSEGRASRRLVSLTS